MEQSQSLEFLSKDFSKIDSHLIENLVQLLDEGATTSFITTYQRDKIGPLEENQVILIKNRYNFLKRLSARKEIGRAHV